MTDGPKPLGDFLPGILAGITPPKPPRKPRISAERLNNILDVADEIRSQSAQDAEALAFMARSMVLCTLPHRDPGDIPAWGRQNGNFSLTIQPGYYLDAKNKPVSWGLPYGSIPRLLMFWVTTEAVRTKSRHLELGNNLAEFMRTIGLDPSTGRGPRSDAARLKAQTIRLFNSRILLSDTSDERRGSNESLQLADSVSLWWDVRSPQQAKLFPSSLTLSERFFNEVSERPIPVDARALAVLKQSPLALDLYAWLTYRVSYLKKPTLITWPQLAGQVGSEFDRLRDFRANVRLMMRRILALYPDLRVSDEAGGLRLLPSPTHVPK